MVFFLSKLIRGWTAERLGQTNRTTDSKPRNTLAASSERSMGLWNWSVTEPNTFTKEENRIVGYQY